MRLRIASSLMYYRKCTATLPSENCHTQLLFATAHFWHNLTQFFSRQQTKRFLARQDRTNGLFRLETKIYLAEMKPLQKPTHRTPRMVGRLRHLLLIPYQDLAEADALRARHVVVLDIKCTRSHVVLLAILVLIRGIFACQR